MKPEKLFTMANGCQIVCIIMKNKKNCYDSHKYVPSKYGTREALDTIN